MTENLRTFYFAIFAVLKAASSVPWGRRCSLALAWYPSFPVLLIAAVTVAITGTSYRPVRRMGDQAGQRLAGRA